MCASRDASECQLCHCTVAHLLFQQILTRSAQAFAPLLDVLERLEHVRDLDLSLAEEVNEAITLLAQARDLAQVLAIQAVLLVLGGEGERREVVVELLRCNDGRRVLWVLREPRGYWRAR